MITMKRAALAMVLLVSILQGTFFAVQQSQSIYGGLGIGFALSTIIILAWQICASRALPVWELPLLLCFQFGFFLMHLASSGPPWNPRLLMVAIALVYLATVLAVLLTGIKVIEPASALLLAITVSFGGFIGEAVLEINAPARDLEQAGSVPEWSGRTEPHPILGQVYNPHSKLTTYYPDNPRNYFDREDLRMAKWHLQVIEGNEASLVMSDNVQEGEVLRVEIRKAETQTSWHIQVNQTHLRVQARQRYRVSYRARTDSARKVNVGFARAHEPWSSLGLYKTLATTSQWESFSEEFIAEADDDNARILFDLGGSAISAEFSDVTLTRVGDGQVIHPNISAKYFVEYQFNALGCRGRDYAIPKPSGTFRILLLGDSFTLGVGVHEKDTVAPQLEKLLREGQNGQAAGINYEVINCGVSGYGTREERLFYELFGAQYQPDLILLLMVWNDDISWSDELQQGYAHRQRGTLESLFEVAKRMQDYRYRRPSANFTKCAEEILRLDSAVRAHRARLGVVIFRIESDYAGITDHGERWNRLTKTVVSGLQDTDIPVLDLGKTLCETPCRERLAVHPFDYHPNENAHAEAARELLTFLSTPIVWQGQSTSLLSLSDIQLH